MIRLRGVRFSYDGAAPALECPDLEIGPGLTLLLGPNGCGKSTLLKIAAGVERPQRGDVTIDGHDPWRDEVAARRGLAYVPEQPDVTPYAAVGDVLRLVCRLRGEPLGRAEGALSEAGLAGLGGRSIRELSMGQKRRAILAAAFIGTPRAILLDEPLETMDRPTRDRILDWVERSLARGALTIVAAHDVAPFAAWAARAVAVEGGKPSLVQPLPDDPARRLALLEGLARGRSA